MKGQKMDPEIEKEFAEWIQATTSAIENLNKIVGDLAMRVRLLEDGNQISETGANNGGKFSFR